MIKSILIENFIIVEKLELDFSKGLQILSGETGAGKSIIVGAIQLSLGGSVRSGMLFDKSKPAIIETSFDIDKNNLELMQLSAKYDIDMAEEEIFFRKEISINLRGKSFINGRRVSNNIIKEFNNVLIDFHGQRDQQKLFDVEYQLELLDKFGNLIPLRDDFSLKYHLLLKKAEELKKLKRTEKNQKEKMKLYEYQITEISSFMLEENEDDNLQKELNVLNHAEDILKSAIDLEHDIYEKDNSIYDSINKYIFSLSEYEEDNIHLKKTVSFLRDSAANLEDAVEEIRNIQGIIELDENRMDSVQERIDTLNNLKMKYKMNITKIIEYSKKIQKEVSSFSSYSQNIEELEKEYESELLNLDKIAKKLSLKRKASAKIFEKELKENINKLAIPDGEVKIKFDKEMGYISKCIDNYKENGLDDIEIYFSANKGKEVQPLKTSASGGELSRFLLAVKKILSDKLTKRTILFDEIDTGIGGKTAELLGEFIFDISKFHQVICITHLAQIAVFANEHYAIYKRYKKDKTVVDIICLEKKNRKKEIARMMSGSDSKIALIYANEIINNRRER